MGEAVATLAFVMEQHLGHRTYADNLRAALADHPGIETHWIPVAYAPTGRWWERFPVQPVRAALRGRCEVRRGLSPISPDACIFNTQVPAVIGGRLARRQPYVLCTDVTPRLMNEMGHRYGHRADTGVVGWMKHLEICGAVRGAARHAAWSSWVRDSLVDHYGVNPERIEVIPPGVDVASRPVAVHGTAGAMRVLFVGSDFERKGGDVLLRAVAQLPAGSTVVHVVTQSRVTATDVVVVHHGLTHDDSRLLELFSTSDVFVLPSSSETFGIAAVEAAASGLPIIVSAVGGLGDLVVHGSTGFLIRVGDVDALSGHLRDLLEQPELRRRLGADARRRAGLEFDAITNAKRLVALAIESALGVAPAAHPPRV